MVSGRGRSRVFYTDTDRASRWNCPQSKSFLETTELQRYCGWVQARDMQWGQGVQLLEDVDAASQAQLSDPDLSICISFFVNRSFLVRFGRSIVRTHSRGPCRYRTLSIGLARHCLNQSQTPNVELLNRRPSSATPTRARCRPNPSSCDPTNRSASTSASPQTPSCSSSRSTTTTATPRPS